MSLLSICTNFTCPGPRFRPTEPPSEALVRLTLPEMPAEIASVPMSTWQPTMYPVLIWEAPWVEELFDPGVFSWPLLGPTVVFGALGTSASALPETQTVRPAPLAARDGEMVACSPVR